MALPVDVQSVEVIRQFRAQLCRFGEDVKNALAATEMEIGRMVNWLTNDRRLYWEGEIRRRRDDVSQAKAELFRKRTSQMYGHDANLAEQRENLRVANHRLLEAEEKLKRVRRWVAPLQQAIMEYRGLSRPLSDMADADLENAVAMLGRMLDALDEYATTAPPSTDYVSTMKEEARNAASMVLASNENETSSPEADETEAAIEAPEPAEEVSQGAGSQGRDDSR